MARPGVFMEPSAGALGWQVLGMFFLLLLLGVVVFNMMARRGVRLSAAAVLAKCTQDSSLAAALCRDWDCGCGRHCLRSVHFEELRTMRTDMWSKKPADRKEFIKNQLFQAGQRETEIPARGGEKLPKSDPLFAALGTLDELNASVGLAVSQAGESADLVDILQYIQCRILDAGTALAAPLERSDTLLKFTCADEAVQILESKIDGYERNLPVLRNFVLPGGNGMLASQLHMCRTVCRRAEREVYASGRADAGLLRFVNRLSDFFFMAARTYQDNEPVVYSKRSQLS
eukprot:jgi/Mesvir1/1919/Mv22949-RA.1